jgi:enoyl-CoA hydratase/carnithine racemase
VEHRASLHDAIARLRDLEGRVPARPGRVTVGERAGTAWIELDNPRAHNALTATMMRELAEGIDALLASDVAVVALASAGGGTFCAGGHLGQVREALVRPDEAVAMSVAMGAALDALAAAPWISVALVEGAAIGGGLELVSACDLCFATPSAAFDPAQVRLGVAAGWGGAGRLARRLGPGVALRLLASGRAISAEEAVRLGLVHHVGPGPAARLLAEGAGALLGRNRAAVRAIKRQIARADDPAEQVAAFLGVWGGPAHRAALGLDP